MARNDEGCFSILGLIVLAGIIISQTFQGNFIPILVIVGVVVVVYLYLSISKIISDDKYSPAEISQKKDFDFQPYLLAFLIIGGIITHLYFENDHANTAVEPNESLSPPEEVVEAVKEPSTTSEPTIWSNQGFYNCSFKVPSNLKINQGLSSEKIKIYVDDEQNLALTVNAEILAEENRDKSIENFTSDLDSYAKNFNENNRSLFDDFILLNYAISTLGNVKCLRIKQSSTKVSGTKNIEMLITTYNVIASPFYYSISFTYPKNYTDYDSLLNSINKTFIFTQEINFKTNTTEFETGYYNVIEIPNFRIYFYETPDESFPRKAYLVGKELVYVEKIINGYGFINFTNPNGVTSSGWINLNYLKKI